MRERERERERQTDQRSTVSDFQSFVQRKKQRKTVHLAQLLPLRTICEGKDW